MLRAHQRRHKHARFLPMVCSAVSAFVLVNFVVGDAGAPVVRVYDKLPNRRIQVPPP